MTLGLKILLIALMTSFIVTLSVIAKRNYDGEPILPSSVCEKNYSSSGTCQKGCNFIQGIPRPPDDCPSCFAMMVYKNSSCVGW